MKKLIILLFLLPFSLNAQIEEDKALHFEAGFMIGATSNAITYVILSDKTNIKPVWCKGIAFFTGVGLSTLAGHIKETNDDHYNCKDLNNTIYGGLAGSFSLTLILWRSRYEKHVPASLIEF